MALPALFLRTLCFSEFLGTEHLTKHLCFQAHGYFPPWFTKTTFIKLLLCTKH